MAVAADHNYRAWLGLELAQDAREALEKWLREALEHDAVVVPESPDLIVLVVGLSGRSAEGLTPLIQGLRNLQPSVVRVEFGEKLQALPSRRRPTIYQLPARCHGIEGILAALASCMPCDRLPVRPEMTRPYLPAGRVRTALHVPSRWPPKLPEGLRGPIDAVRLGLYCSQITPEHYRLDPLAQVKLPMAAAVR